MRDELGTVIRCDMGWNMVLGKYMDKKSLANCVEVMVLCVGMKLLCLVKRSTTTKIAVNPSESMRCSMKSMEMECHGREGTGS